MSTQYENKFSLVKYDFIVRMSFDALEGPKLLLLHKHDGILFISRIRILPWAFQNTGHDVQRCTLWAYIFIYTYIIHIHICIYICMLMVHIIFLYPMKCFAA